MDDFALRRRQRWATVVIDAETHERIDVLPDRTADPLQACLRQRSGIEVVCRDGSATYAEAIRRALPDAVQVADRWHLWKNLCNAALGEVKAHSACWAGVLDTPLYDGPRAQTTLERWQHVHGLLDQGVDLLECARRLQPSLNTVKRYARADHPQRMLRVPKYRASLVDPYRERLRELLARLTAACPEMTALAAVDTAAIGRFAELLTASGRQSRPAHALDQPGSRGRPASPARLHPRAAT